jgi:galactoside 2-L-fucosyltransferase 1/2
MTLERFTRVGFATAPESYISTAMKFYTKKFSNSVIFIICSNDRTWVRENIIRWNFKYIFVSNNKDPMVDLAILSMCDHSIITSGTFGWWGGWLAGGMVVYYKGFPAPNTSLSTRIHHSDYYPPNWIGME